MDPAIQAAYIQAKKDREESAARAVDLRAQWLASLVPGDTIREAGSDTPLIFQSMHPTIIKVEDVDAHRPIEVRKENAHPWTAEDDARFQDKRRWRAVRDEVQKLATKNPPRDQALLEQLEALLVRTAKPTELDAHMARGSHHSECFCGHCLSPGKSP